MPEQYEHPNGWSKWSEYVLRTLESMVADLKTVWDKQIRQELLLEQLETIQSQVMERIKILQDQNAVEREDLRSRIDDNYRLLDNKLDAIKNNRIEHQQKVIEKSLGEKVKGHATNAAPAGVLVIIWKVLEWLSSHWEEIRALLGS